MQIAKGKRIPMFVAGLSTTFWTRNQNGREAFSFHSMIWRKPCEVSFKIRLHRHQARFVYSKLDIERTVNGGDIFVWTNK